MRAISYERHHSPGKLGELVTELGRRVRTRTDFVDRMMRMSRLFGGYITVAIAENAQPIMISTIGEMDASKVDKYFSFSQEKAIRLSQNHPHKTSRESRDEKLERYAGAVRGMQLIVSCSGWPEDLDEVLAMGLLVMLEEKSLVDASLVLNGNPYFEQGQFARLVA